MVGGVFNNPAPAIGVGQEIPLQLDSAGNLLVNVAVGGGGGGSNPSVGLTGANVPASATYIAADNPGGKLTGLNVDASGNLFVNIAAGGGTGGGPADVGLSTAASETDAARQKVTSALRLWDQTQAAGSQLVGWRGDTTSGAWVNVKNTVPITGTVTVSNPDVQFADNAASGASPTGTLMMGWDSANSVVRALKVDAGQALLTHGIVTQLPVAVTLTDTLANPTTTEIGANLLGWDATNSVWRRVQVDAATGVLKVDIGSNGTVAISGSVNVNATQVGTWTVGVNAFPSGSGALSDGLPNPTVFEIGSNLLGWDATNTVWRRVQVDAGTGTLKVDGSGSTQPVSGTVTVSGFANPLPVSQSGNWNVNQAIGVAGFEKITDGTNTVAVTAASALKVDGSAVTQPVSIAATVNVSVQNATLAVTQSTSPWVDNVSQFGGNNVVTGTGVSGAGIPRVTVSSDSFPATQAISAVSLPLPANATQETGGNLDTITKQTRNDPQIADVLSMILAQIKLLNLNFSSVVPGSHVDNDTFLLDTIPTT